MKLHPKQVESVLALQGPARYDHFIKQAAGQEEVWGLYKDGWALAATDEGEDVFPVWPDEEYAALSARAEWDGYEPTSIPLDDFMEELLPALKRDGVLPGVFYTPSDKGVTPQIEQLLADLSRELGKYE